jgi:gliding motility-associated-like protein
MTDQNISTPIFKWMLLFVLIITSYKVGAQCAGSDATVTVCDKDQNLSTRTYILFDKLGGLPSPGGTWATTDPANYVALDRTNGIVDLWRINNNGVHQFVYTNTACGESATVSINLGGYPGENNVDGSANACSDDSSVNLHSFLGSEIDEKVQDFNGLWEEVPIGATNFLTGYNFDAFQAGPGVYTFTYTVPAVSSCPSRQSTVVLEVHPAPNPGLPNDLVVCTNEDLSAFTNVDLNAYLSGEDLNGTWSESGTNQLSDLTDHEIDVQAINSNFGYGTYNFRYTVFPTHPVCTKLFAEVSIKILPALDGTLSPPNFCVGTPYDVPLAYDSSILPNGEYRIEYRINDSDGIQTAFDDATLSGGQGTLRVNPSIVAPNEFVALDIVGIEGINPVRDVCPNIIVPQATFLVSDASASAADVCPNTDATIMLTNVLDVSGNLSNEIYTLGYTITDLDNNTSNYTAQNISFTNGNANFDIPSTNLTNPGQYEAAIDIPNSFDLDCIGTTFTLIPAPEDISLDLIVDNNCDATQIEVVVDAPVLTDGGYIVTYNVTEMDSSDVLVSNTIGFNGGTANYLIDIATLPQGNYTVVLQSTQNDTTPCRTTFDFELQENFAIGGIPEMPVAEANQTFCTNYFGTNSLTLSDLAVTATGDISFFATENDTNILPMTTALVHGEDYFVTSTDPNNNCESSERVRVVVVLTTSGTPTTTNPNPVFCASENATIADLEATTPNNGTLIWYDATTGGNSLDASEILIDGKSYFASEQLNGSCESDVRLEIVPTVYGLEPVSLEFTDLAICGLDNPTIGDLRNLETMNDNEVLWYDSVENGAPLNDDVLLDGNATYYAESYNSETGCINPERVAVTVDLTNCDPEDYGFFIPDGFSPNNDGRNDTFFIPNIEAIFPDFTLEILNRYGAPLFKGDRNNPSWDGDKAPNGVYFYIIKYHKNGHEPKQGRLYLNR